MRSLRELLTTWENWSARDTLARAFERASKDDARETLRRSQAKVPEVDPLDALHDATELIALLLSWRWQAMYAARIGGASWCDVGAAVEMSGEQARRTFAKALDRQDVIRPGAGSCYRAVL